MKNLSFLFAIFFLSLASFTTGCEDIGCENTEEILRSCSRTILFKDGKTDFDLNRTWVFNDQVYLLNDSEQWILASSRARAPRNIDEYLDFHASRGLCFKGHKGEYLDTSFYTQGVWYCKGMMKDGNLCPYHLKNQFPPDGIPPQGKMALSCR